jgi:hypothetical protein
MRQVQVTGKGKRQTTTDNFGMRYGGILIHLAGGNLILPWANPAQPPGFGAACSARCIKTPVIGRIASPRIRLPS